ncbi:MAG TPA: UDP-N-acetylglucosamine 2-epimerase (non-hydrolyzing) [Fimbriimonas sp.]|nr:UDP-N-acetylglucosamine 2-epimerase (non-hydrolyzing) [Fimbriimonas sp.]
MPDKPTLFCVIGTRPEAIKMAPVVLELRRYSYLAETVLISTGQHREILLQALATFGLNLDEDLEIMTHGQTLAQVTSRAVEGLDSLIADRQPSMVLAQGDTTTTFAAALVSFYRRVPFAHIEAGLRTDTIDNPFPEEFNRRAAGLVAGLHFPPTTWARDNLLSEGKNPETIHVTGNTGVDAVLAAANATSAQWYPSHAGRVLVLTTHRRENWGDPQRRIASAIRELVDEFPDVLLVTPMHPNPQVREVLRAELGDHPRIELIEPPEYESFVGLMKRANLIYTDSGGVQEEAPAFGIPVLVLRDTTERPEGVTAGTAKLIGTRREEILNEGRRLLSDESAYREMAQAVSPYGDGHASERIRFHVLRQMGIESPEVPHWN